MRFRSFSPVFIRKLIRKSHYKTLTCTISRILTPVNPAFSGRPRCQYSKKAASISAANPVREAMFSAIILFPPP